MPRLVSSEVLNAPSQDVSLSIPAGGVFILKQLLSQYIGWDTEDAGSIDELDAILAQTIALRGYSPMIVYEDHLPNNQAYDLDSEVVVNFQPGQQHPSVEVLPFPNGLRFNDAGFYHVCAEFYADSITTAQGVRYLARCRDEGSNVIYLDRGRVWPDFVSRMPFHIQATAGQVIRFTYSFFQSGTLSLNYYWTRLRVVRF